MAEPTTYAADPYTIAYIAGSFALGGAALAGALTWVGNYYSNKQRAKHEREALEMRLRHEERDRDIKLKLEGIERAFRLIIEIGDQTRESGVFIRSKVKRTGIELSEFQDWSSRIWRSGSELRVVSYIYAREIAPDVDKITKDIAALMRLVRQVHDSILTAAQEIEGDAKSNYPDVEYFQFDPTTFRVKRKNIVKNIDILRESVQKNLTEFVSDSGLILSNNVVDSGKIYNKQIYFHE